MDKVAFLSQTPLFSDLSPDELEALIKLLKVATYEDGEYIFVEGDPASALFIVIDGRVELIKEIADGIEKTVCVLASGDVFGEMGVLEGAERSAAALARGTVRLLWIGAELFHDLMRDRPLMGAKILYGFARLLSARLRSTTELYGNAVRWALEVSGAERLGFHDLIEEAREHTFCLRGGERIRGRLVRVDVGAEGARDFTIRTDQGAFLIVPYHAIERFEIDCGATVPISAEVK